MVVRYGIGPAYPITRNALRDSKLGTLRVDPIDDGRIILRLLKATLEMRFLSFLLVVALVGCTGVSDRVSQSELEKWGINPGITHEDAVRRLTANDFHCSEINSTEVGKKECDRTDQHVLPPVTCLVPVYLGENAGRVDSVTAGDPRCGSL
jgi:hypothetical protein